MSRLLSLRLAAFRKEREVSALMSVSPLRVLLVEDQFLIAKQLEVIIEGEGHNVIGIATNRDEACNLAIAAEPDIAFVDISLADGPTGMEVADFIAENCRAEVVFTTANKRRLPPDFCGAIGIVEKPFTRAGMVAALNYIAEQVRKTRMNMERPESLQLSPRYLALWHPVQS